jgi:hypothetical protein
MVSLRASVTGASKMAMSHMGGKLTISRGLSRSLRYRIVDEHKPREACR